MLFSPILYVLVVSVRFLFSALSSSLVEDDADDKNTVLLHETMHWSWLDQRDQIRYIPYSNL